VRAVALTDTIRGIIVRTRPASGGARGHVAVHEAARQYVVRALDHLGLEPRLVPPPSTIIELVHGGRVAVRGARPQTQRYTVVLRDGRREEYVRSRWLFNLHFRGAAVGPGVVDYWVFVAMTRRLRPVLVAVVPDSELWGPSGRKTITLEASEPPRGVLALWIGRWDVVVDGEAKRTRSRVCGAPRT
jgi:hypothetical protein